MTRDVYVEPTLEWAASEAVAAFDWTGVTPEERARVLDDLSFTHVHGGAPVSWWLGELQRLLRQARGEVTKDKLGFTPVTDLDLGGGFAGKLPQRERPPPSDDEDEEPTTKINPRRRG